MSDDKKKHDDDDFDPYNFFKLEGSEEPDNHKQNKKQPKKRFPFWGIMIIILGLLALFNIFFEGKNSDQLSFSAFMDKVNAGEIVKVDIINASTAVGYGPEKTVASKGVKKGIELFKVPEAKTREQYKATILLTEEFMQTLEANNVEINVVNQTRNPIVDLLLQLAVPLGIILLLYFLLFRKMGSGGSGGMGSIFGAGGSRTKAVEEGKVKTRFADVAGVDEAKEELIEVVDFLKSPKKYTDIGGKIPKGVLLVGPPGTGKTLLARAVAGEAGVPFFSISGSDFVEMFVGVGASRVRDLFKQAREKAPCIVFIDEIDALGKSRVNGFGGGNDEREQTLNQLLVEMDGFENEKGLIILAATNRADILDPALLRPGRFDRHVPVELPDVKGREEILRIHAKHVKLDSDVDFVSVAHGTQGFAGADLANVVNEAALLAVRNGRKKVTMEDFNEAIDKVSIGLKKKSRKDNKKQMRLTSVHETGHALVGAFTEGHEPVNKITVVPRSHGVGGFTQYREEEEEKFCLTYKDMINEVDSMLGGRAAEQIVLGDISTGASNDIARATEIIKSMIVDYGMSERFKNMTLGKGVLGNRGGEPNLVREFSEQTQNYIDEEISRLMNERYEHVVKLLEAHKDLLEYIANRLVEVETMDGKEFYEIIKGEAHCKELLKAEKSGADETAEKSAEESLEKSADVPAKTEESAEVQPEKKVRKRRTVKKSAEEKPADENK